MARDVARHFAFDHFLRASPDLTAEFVASPDAVLSRLGAEADRNPLSAAGSRGAPRPGARSCEHRAAGIEVFPAGALRGCRPGAPGPRCPTSS